MGWLVMKRLKQKLIKPVVTPQCCVPFDESGCNEEYLNRRRQQYVKPGMEWKSNQCGKPSSYEIRGKFYCATHAGHVALDILMESED
jgi:hypothetical protein